MGDAAHVTGKFDAFQANSPLCRHAQPRDFRVRRLLVLPPREEIELMARTGNRAERRRFEAGIRRPPKLVTRLGP